MGRQSRTEADWKIVNQVLLRAFVGWSVAALLSVGLVLLIAHRDLRVLFGALTAGGWMVANCVGMTWMGSRALRQPHQHPARSLAGFLATVVALLALGAWLVLACRPAPLGLTVGFSIPLAIFFFHLRQLKLTLDAHAR